MMIRSMTAADADAASSCVNRIFGDEYRGHPITAQFAIELERSRLAIDRGMIVAIAIVTISELNEEYLPELKIFGVLPEYRRRGIGGRLLQACMEGNDDIFLIVRAGNEVAMRMYSSAGIEPRYIIRDYYSRPAEHGIVMQK